MNHNYQKDISGCGMTGIFNKKGKRIRGDMILASVACLKERGSGLGGGFAAYGIYPEFKEYYAFHLMYHNRSSKKDTEEFMESRFIIELKEEIPTSNNKNVINPPGLWRYFIKPPEDSLYLDFKEVTEEDYIVNAVMEVNTTINGAYVFSSGKNMGAFKGVGYADDIGKYFRIEEYEGYLWTGHHRFPTNTPGWWGGAHPFTLLDWSIVHNGEISSYGINKRYLEAYGYKCTLMTDTEVISYLLDLLIRRHNLPIHIACSVLAPPFWKEIDIMENEQRDLMETLRYIYPSAILNGPFAIIFGMKNGIVGLNDRIKLRPLVAAEKDDYFFISSEEAAIREISPHLDRVWLPRAGDPVMAFLEEIPEC